MTPEQYCYWLQGHCELSENERPSAEQWTTIKENLRLIFDKKIKIGLQDFKWPFDTTQPAMHPQLSPLIGSPGYSPPDKKYEVTC